jgi:primosomal protein N'
MSSAARSSSAETLSGPVAVCVDRPILSLDRPFTYDLSEDLGAGVGSLVQVPFHGKAIRGWVLGPTEDLPPRLLKVRKLVSPVRFFDAPSLELMRWVSERYVAPLASVIERCSPPRVASEEVAVDRSGPARRVAGPRRRG